MKDIEELQSAIMFLMSFIPDWAKETKEGMPPDYYGTLSYESDLRVVDRVKGIKELISK